MHWFSKGVTALETTHSAFDYAHMIIMLRNTHQFWKPALHLNFRSTAAPYADSTSHATSHSPPQALMSSPSMLTSLSVPPLTLLAGGRAPRKLWSAVSCIGEKERGRVFLGYE